MATGSGGKVGVVILAAALACGCANSGFDLTTASLTNETPAAAPKTDPVCVSLASQIDTLRGDGTIDRLEKAGSGKGVKVEVKRAALLKQAELNKANADFQTRCGPSIPRSTAAQATPAPTVAPAAKSAATASPSAAPVKSDVN